MNKLKYIAAFGIFGVITTEFSVIGILPKIARYYNITMDYAALLLSGFALVIALFGPWITLITSKIDKKKIMLFTMLLFLISNLVSALAPPFIVLLIVRIVPAFFHPVFFSAAISVALMNSSKEDKHKNTAIIFAGVSIGAVIGIPLTTFIADIFNWQFAFWGCFIINFIAGGLILYYFPLLPIKKFIGFRKQIKSVLNISFLLQAVTTTLMIASMFTVYGYFAFFMEKNFGLSGKQISTMLFLFGLVGVLGNWIAGKLLTKSIIKTLFVFLISLSLVFIMIFNNTDFNWLTLLLIALWGLFHTGCFVIGQTYINSAAPDAQDFANSLGVAFTNLGIALGTTLGGYVIATSNVKYILYYGVGLLILTLLIISAKQLYKLKLKPNKK